MITLITGAPGTGKSAALVSLLAQLSKGRAVYVNGIPDLSIDHQPLEDASKWPDVVPDGSIIVIDEVQRVWRPLGPGQKVPADIAALETHRHRGIDFYIVTQAPRLVHTNVRALVGRHVHLRDLGIIGRWWYEWPECSENCANSWKSAPIKKRYRLPKAAFKLYKSASEHIKPVRSVPWMLAVMVIALCVTAFMSFKVYGMISSKISPAPITPLASSPPASPSGQIGPTTPDTGQSLDYDYSAFIPRISSKPESAPAYDTLRVVMSMPVVAGGACMAEKCKCYTSQGTDAGLSSSECRQWIDNRPFNPYLDPAAAGTASADKQSISSPSGAPAAAGQIVYGSGPSPSSALAIGGSTIPTL